MCIYVYLYLPKARVIHMSLGRKNHRLSSFPLSFQCFTGDMFSRGALFVFILYFFSSWCEDGFYFSPLFFLFANPEGLTIICVLPAHCFSVELNSFHCLFTSCTAGWQCLLSTPLLFVIILQEYPSETVCMQNIYESFSESIASCFIMSTHNVRGGRWW